MGEREDTEDQVVLIVEDDPSIAELVRHVVEGELGVHTLVAEDGERGLALAREARPGVVLLDVHLPKLSGLEVARRLKSDPGTRDLPLVAMTSEPETDTLAAGCSAHLAKPFDLDDLTGLVGKYLDFGSRPREVASRSEAPISPPVCGERLRLAARRLCIKARTLQARSRALCGRADAARLRSMRLLEVARSQARQAA